MGATLGGTVPTGSPITFILSGSFQQISDRMSSSSVDIAIDEKVTSNFQISMDREESKIKLSDDFI